MINTTIINNDIAFEKLLEKLAQVMFLNSEYSKDKKFIYINNIKQSYRTFTKENLLAEVAFHEGQFAEIKAKKLAATNERKSKIEQLRAKKATNAALKNQPSPSRGQATERVTLKESQEILNQKSKAYIAQIGSTTGFVAPMAFVIPPGGGKTYINANNAALAYMQGLPSVILTPNHGLADEVAVKVATQLIKLMNEQGASHAEIEGALSEVVHYQGRKPFNPKFSRNEFTCFQHPSTGIAGEQNQPISSSLCYNCPNGRLGEIEHGPQEKREANILWFTKNEIKQHDYKSKECQFLRVALPQQLAAKVLIAPTAAYSEAMSVYHSAEGITIQRLVIVDELVSLNRRVEIKSANVIDWHKSVNALISYILEDKQHANINNLEILEKTLELLKKINLGIATGIFKDKTKQDYKELVNEIIAVKKELQKSELTNGGITAFEKISFYQKNTANDITDHFLIPLRAFCDLATEMEAERTDSKTDSFSCVIHVLTQIAARALNKGRIIFTDATMPDELQELVESKGGEVVRLNVVQNITVTRVTEHEAVLVHAPVAKIDGDAEDWATCYQRQNAVRKARVFRSK